LSDEELGIYIQSLEAQGRALGEFLHLVAAALGVQPAPFGGIAEERVMNRIYELTSKEN